MTLPANDDLSNRELSIEDLDAIAAGLMVGGFPGMGLPHPVPQPRVAPPLLKIYTGPRVNGLSF